MKKIKLFALAAFAMLSTNAFAAVGDVKAAGNFRYEVTNATAGSEAATIIGFVAGHEQAEVVIPSTVADPDADITYKVTAIGKATTTAASLFQNLDVITKVTIPDENVVTLTANAFTGCENLTEVTIGKAVTLIDDEAFMNCAKLATVKFNAPAADAVTPLTIDVKAFEGTAIAELDLTNTNMTTLNPLFTNDDDADDTWTKNKKLTTIKLPKTLATIAANAFDNCLLLGTIDFSKCEADLTINAEAFEGTIFLEELELPACVATIAANALAGSSITTLTINSHKTAGKPVINAIGGADLKSIIVKGDFVGAFGDGANAVSATFTSLTFKGAVGDGTNTAIKAAAATGATLGTVTFEGEVKAAAIASSSFKAFNKSKLNLIVPFVETLFDEIFSYERKYVVFCARKFEKVFHEYNKTHPGSVTIKKIKNKWIPSRSKSKPGSCIGLYINYKNFKMKAIIANTFPRQDLPNAYDLMEDYGEFCYNEFLKL